MALQFIRGLDADRLSLTPAVGEPLFTTDTKRLYIGDGSTVGGVEVRGTDSATVISIIQENVFDSADISTLFNAFLAIKSTGDVTEGSNLYYTQARVDSDINAIVSALDTDNIPEAGNLYYTQARVDSDITNTVTQSYVNALLIDADTLDGQNGTYFLDYNNFNNTPSNVSEFINDAGYTTYDSANAAGQITSAIDALIAGAPGALDTLNELAAALGDDANFATTVTNAIAALPDSAEVATIITDIVDSAYITARTPPSLTIREVDSADNVNKTINSVSAINFDNWTGFQVTDLGGGEVKVALGSGFKTITVDGQDNIVAIGEDTLAIDAGTNVTLATDAVTKTLTISATFDSAEVTNIVDSAYVTARIPEIPSVTVSGTAPASPTEGDLWYDNVTTGQLYTYVGTSWLSTAGLTTLQFSSVGDLSDVDITTAAPTNGQFLAWDSANSKFVPGSETPQDFAYSSLTGAPTNVSSFTNDAGYITAADALDSAEVVALVDSAYVQSRQTPQDFAYSSLTGAPTNVSSFTNDAGYITAADALDSVETQALIDAAVAALVDTAPATLDTLNELAAALGDDANFATTVTNAIAALPDSAEVATIVTSYGYATQTYVDGAVAALPDSSEVQAIATTLVDSAYVQARQTPQDFAYSSLTGAPTNVSSFTNDANYLDSNTVTGVIDATYINSLVTATDSAAVISIVTDTVDSAYVTARIPEIPSVTVSGTAPASPSEGDLWYDNVTTGQLYTYVGTSWLSTAGLTTLQFSSIADLADVDSSAPTDGQYLTWNSATSQYVPTTLDAGTDSATVASIVTSTIDSSYTITGDVDNTNITTYFLNYKDTGYQILADEGGWLYIRGTDTDQDIIVRTNASGSGENDFVFGKDASLTLPGSLVFQDATVQTTAYNTVAVTADINNVVDSAYVQSRQDFDYNSLINAPANVSDFSNDANYIATGDSAALASLTTTGNVVIGGNLQVNGTTVTVNTTDLDVTDNMIYMNAGESAGSPTASIDVGWAANVNDQGSYYHVGLFRDATDQTFKVYHQYTPEPDAAVQINTGDASFALAPFAASTLTGVYQGFDSDVTAAGLATQTYVTSTIDSAYIQARVDSAYVNGLVTIPSGVTVSGTAPASPTEGDLWYDNVTTGQLYTYVGTSWLSTAGLTTLQFSSIADLSDVDSSAPTEGQYLAWNSATSQYVPTTLAAGTDSGTVVGIVTSTVDSAYIQLRQTPQDFAYSSLTGAPTNVSSFTNDAGYLTTAIDSTGVTSLIDAAVAALVDTAPSTLDTLNELAAALGDDANFATTVTNAIAAKLDSAQTIALIDSAYINARVSATDSAAVISIITATVDSAYVNNLVTIPSGVVVSGTAPVSPTEGDLWYDDVTTGELYVYENGSWTSTGIPPSIGSIGDLGDVDLTTSPTNGQVLLWDSATSNFIPGTVETGTDSAAIVSLIDSAYVQARQTAQDFAYSSLTGAPTNVSSFTNDAGYLTTAIDSTGVTTLIDAAVAALVDTAPATLDTLNELAAALGDDANFATTVTNAIAALPDSAEVATIVQSYGYTTTTVDSAAPANPSEGDFWFDDTNSGQLYIYENSAWTSTSIPPAYFDSANAIALIDSAYVQSRQDFAYSSLTGAPTNISSFTNDAGYLTSAIDSTGVTSLIDAAVAALVDTAPATLDTLNELAAALGDDANFATTVTNAIAAKLDSAQTIALIDSAYINARVDAVGGTDSATVISLINSTIDSDFVLGLVGASVSGVSTYEYTAAASQTTFSGTDDNGATLAYTAGNILVHRNGILIVSTVDYVATNGTSVVLQSAADSGDTISVIAYQPTLVNASETTITSDVQTATSGQTSFTVAHTQGQILVFLNGILLKDTDDYVSNGSTVVLTQSADSGDQITVHNFAKYSAAGSGTNTSAVYAYSILFGA